MLLAWLGFICIIVVPTVLLHELNRYWFKKEIVVQLTPKPVVTTSLKSQLNAMDAANPAYKNGVSAFSDGLSSFVLILFVMGWSLWLTMSWQAGNFSDAFLMAVFVMLYLLPAFIAWASMKHVYAFIEMVLLCVGTSAGFLLMKSGWLTINDWIVPWYALMIAGFIVSYYTTKFVVLWHLKVV